ncbi:MAG TPA: short-chain dehydrogenase [Methylophilaceae bacterium]|nr:short-chain dehydrogenase [Methylophilaceae bacterium]HAJ71673.1 short-chain dehydrogenase [Methylophilaceae bacterium]
MQKIFITGASSGIGEALAFEYAKRYAHGKACIGLVARRSEHLHAIASQIQSHYQITCVVYVCDVRDQFALLQAAQHFIQHHGVPNIVIANAGASTGTLTEHVEDVKAFQAVMEINLMGMVHTFQPFIQAMKIAAKNGEQAQLVGIASVAGIRGLPGAGAYCASKAAAITYLESLRVELQSFNIHVTTIAPGYIRTPMTNINHYPMPFLMGADVFARKLILAVAQKKRFVIIPWQMSLLAKIMRVIPPILWDWIMKNAPHKARINIK